MNRFLSAVDRFFGGDGLDHSGDGYDDAYQDKADVRPASPPPAPYMGRQQSLAPQPDSEELDPDNPFTDEDEDEDEDSGAPTGLFGWLHPAEDEEDGEDGEDGEDDDVPPPPRNFQPVFPQGSAEGEPSATEEEPSSFADQPPAPPEGEDDSEDDPYGELATAQEVETQTTIPQVFRGYAMRFCRQYGDEDILAMFDLVDVQMQYSREHPEVSEPGIMAMISEDMQKGYLVMRPVELDYSGCAVRFLPPDHKMARLLFELCAEQSGNNAAAPQNPASAPVPGPAPAPASVPEAPAPAHEAEPPADAAEAPAASHERSGRPILSPEQTDALLAAAEARGREATGSASGTPPAGEEPLSENERLLRGATPPGAEHEAAVQEMAATLSGPAPTDKPQPAERPGEPTPPRTEPLPRGFAPMRAPKIGR